MNFTMVENYPQNKKSTIAIRPYFEEKRDNMGLQNYGLTLFDGAFHEEPIILLEINGIKRYVTGLNEYAPDIIALPEEERISKIKQIRQIVSQLEKQLNANVVDPEDKEFWNKVKLLKPDNPIFWDEIKLRCSNEPVFLEPDKDPYDLIKLLAIENGGFDMVAKSLEHARTMAKPPKFYLDKLETTASTNTEVSKLRNKAGGELDKLFTKNTNKLFYVAKVLDPQSTQYHKSTPHDILYQNMDKYINGLLSEKDKKKTAERFLQVAALDMETLKLRAMVKDASVYKIITTKADGFIYHLSTSTMLGRNQTDVVEYLKNPLNEQILMDVQKQIESYWNK